MTFRYHVMAKLTYWNSRNIYFSTSKAVVGGRISRWESWSKNEATNQDDSWQAESFGLFATRYAFGIFCSLECFGFFHDYAGCVDGLFF